jgi:hypothetical protein
MIQRNNSLHLYEFMLMEFLFSSNAVKNYMVPGIPKIEFIFFVHVIWIC